jgi:glycosyltransferase involved in cell wall biosynthesis
MPKIKVIIPAYNEADSIGFVIKNIPSIVNEIIVVSNHSNDDTEINAKNAGATVLIENRRGYGYACLKGMDYIANLENAERPDIIVFLDGDYSDYPEELTNSSSNSKREYRSCHWITSKRIKRKRVDDYSSNLRKLVSNNIDVYFI